jgi:Zn-dependent metalloprotease
MADVSEQIEYWQKIAEEDWEVGKELIENNKTRHGLFLYILPWRS